MIIMIYACDENNAIGKDGDLPWRQSTDLQHFKSITSGGTIVMGRKTWESLPGKLPNRKHVVLTRGVRTDVETATFDEIIEMAKSQDLFVIGGGEIYELFLNDKDTLKKEASKYLEIFRDHPYIFNLGHGILPETNPEMVENLIKIVKNFK